MTFPAIVNSSSGTSAASTTTSHTVTLPASIVAGNLLLVFAFNGLSTGGSTTTPAGWNVLYQGNAANKNLAILWRIADGTEGATLALTWSTGGRGTWTAYQISGWDPASTPALGTPTTFSSSTGPASPALTPSWGALDTMWISALGLASGSGATVTTYPSGYTLGQLYAQDIGFSGQHSISAVHDNNTATETPGAYTLSIGSTGVAATVGISPLVATNVTPTGVSTTSAAGSLGPTVAKALVGVALIAAVGSFTPSVTPSFSGVQSSTAAGTLSEISSPNVSVIGVSATASPGSIGPTVSDTPLGVQANSQVNSFNFSFVFGAGSVASAGNLSEAISPPTIGVSATSHAGLFSDTVSYGPIGVNATSGVGNLAETLSPNIPLSGASAAASPGSFAPSVTYGLLGASAISAAGQFNVLSLLPGVSATSAAGVLSETSNPIVNLVGVSAAASPGSFVPVVTYGLLGASAISSPGTFIPDVISKLAGVSATSAAGILSDTSSPNVTPLGVQSNSSAGVFKPTVKPPYSGVSATAHAGSLAGSPGGSLLGVQAVSGVGRFLATGVKRAIRTIQVFYH